MTYQPRPDSPADRTRVDRATNNIEQHLLGQRSPTESGSVRALYDELHSLRQQDTLNGRLNLSQFKTDAAEVMEKLHKDGFLPRLRLVMDGRNNLGVVDNQGQFIGKDAPLQPGDVPQVIQRRTGMIDATPPVVLQGDASRLPPGQSDGLADQAAAAAADAGRRIRRPPAEGDGAAEGSPRPHGRGHRRGGRHHRGGRGRRGGRGEAHGRRGACAEGDSEAADGQDSTMPESDLPNGRPRSLSPSDSGQPWQSSGDSRTVPVQRLRNDGDMKVTTAPTITPQKIDEVLKQYHSPAYGRVSGQEVYDKSVQHGINPAIALAFYVCESSAGTKGLGAKNNSWGNIRGNGHRGYKSYDNIHSSLDHFLDLLSGKGYVGQGKDTLGKIIPKYAPSSDGNRPSSYIKHMADLVRQWEN